MRTIESRENPKIRDLTREVEEALLNEDRVTVIRDASILRSDRPHDAGKWENTGMLGDSVQRAGMPYQLNRALRTLSSERGKLYDDDCNVHIFDPISEYDFPHYHGYSREQIQQERAQGNRNAMEAIIILMHTIAPFDQETQTVFFRENAENIVDDDGNDAVIVISEENGILKKQTVRAGDMVILPSGVLHTFSALPGIFGSYLVREISDSPDVMYQTHYAGTRDPRVVIANTIEHETGVRPADISSLTLADVPSLRPYVETR